MFEVGSYIVCGHHGVCKVEEIGPLKMNNSSEGKQYYTLSQVYSKGGMVYVPVDNDKIVMRPVLSSEEAEQLISEITSAEEIHAANVRQEEAAYKEAIRSCDNKEWVKVIKTLYHKKQMRNAIGKRATSSDERNLHAAEEQLHGELAVALGMTKSEVVAYILKKIGMEATK